jgi:hypothetical protein
LNVAGNLGPKPVVTWQGKPYTLSFFCPAVVTLIEGKVVELAYAEADALPESVRGRQVAAVTEAVRAGQHRFGESMFQERTGSRRGSVLTLWGCIAHNHPDFTVEQATQLAVDERAAVERATAEVTPSFLDELVRLGLVRPRPEPPTTAPAGSADTPAS